MILLLRGLPFRNEGSQPTPDEVICFGFFDGDVDGVWASAAQDGYEGQLAAIAPYVESTGADGLYEVVEDFAK